MSPLDRSPVSLEISQVEQGATVLAEALQHDPMTNYIIYDRARMVDTRARFYQANIRMGLLYGEVFTTHSVEGVAVWLSPGNSDFTFGQLLRSGLLKASFSMGLKAMGRLLKYANYSENLKKEAISRPHWFLLLLGVEPSQQGNGLGGLRIQPILARADAEGVPCYLDSTDERNHTFFKRHGFEVAAHGQLSDRGRQIWGMLREPGQK